MLATAGILQEIRKGKEEAQKEPPRGRVPLRTIEVLEPCIRLARLQFELTNQNSDSKKNCIHLCTDLASMKGITVRQLSSLGMAF